MTSTRRVRPRPRPERPSGPAGPIASMSSPLLAPSAEPPPALVSEAIGSTTTKEALMRLQVKGRNVEVTPSIRDYAERKLAKLSKQLAEQTQVEVELSEQKNPSIAARAVAEATIFTKGPTLRAREASPDMKASIDQLVHTLERQVKRYRELRRVEPRRHADLKQAQNNGDAA